MINEFLFKMPTKVIFGNGVINQVGQIVKELGAQKIMLVADKGVRSTGLTEKVADALRAEGIAIVDWDRIVPNPRITDCEAAAKLGRDEGIEAFVAVGGGSSIDTAKAAAGMLGHNTLDFDVIKFPKEYTCEAMPLIAIPTTAGTGSEVTTCGVITDESTHTKVFCYDPKCAPTVALADPEVLLGLPEHIASATGLDALTHAIEGYVAQCTNPITEAMGLYAITLLHDNLRDYIYRRNINVCEAMMMGSLMAGISFGYSDTCSVHSMSESIGGEYDTPHGVANAIFLADVCEYSIPSNLPKYVNIAKALGIKSEGLSDREAAQAGVEEIRMLVSDLKIPKFSALDRVDPADFERIARKCEAHISNPDNPRPLTAGEFFEILTKVYNA